MSDLRIKEITFYSFLFLIIGLILTSGILYFSLNKIKNLNTQLSQLSTTQNSFIQVKVDSENLLISNDLTNQKVQWKEATLIFDENLTKLTFINKKRVEELWYITKKEIEEINEILKDDYFKPLYIQQKSILSLKGELFISKNKNEQFESISELTRKVEYLIQYENLIFKEFKRIYKNEKVNIDKQINNTIYFTMIFILFIILTIIVVIGIVNKKITKIEFKLINTQNNLENKILEIKESKLLLQNIIDSIPAAIFWKDIHNRYLGVNKYILSNAGFERHSDMLGKTDLDMPWADTQAKYFIEDDKKVILSGESKLQYEEQLTLNDGSTITVITSKVPLRNTKNEIIGMLGIYIDISEKKAMQETINKKNRLLSQQSKMAALGEMLENIAHQWRQPLSLILSTTTGLKLKKEYDQLTDKFLLESIENIIYSVEHLNQTINDFRDYFKPDKMAKYFNISKMVDKSLILVQSKLKNNLIDVNIDINSMDAYGYENEFIQVLMNVLNNSIDEFHNKDIKNKVIFIKSKVLDNCKNLIEEEVCDYKCVEIKIYDNAGGIPEYIMDKIFKPYFTTKGDEGTGIGLYMSKEMVKDHMKGSIKASNIEFEYKENSYKGALFTIVIPSEKYDSIIK